MPNAAWCHIEEFEWYATARKPVLCSTPRHSKEDGVIHEAKWVFVLTEDPDVEGEQWQNMCDECISMIASSLGTTPEKGALKPAK